MEGIVWESVWVAVGFVIFVALVWKRIGSVLNLSLIHISEPTRLR